MSLFSFSFYNYKSLENGVAPNVALTPLPLGKVGPMSPSVPSTSHPNGGEQPGEGANSRPRKRRVTEEHHSQTAEPPCPPSFTTSKPPPPQEDKDSEVEIEVESRDECKSTSSPNYISTNCFVAENLPNCSLWPLVLSLQSLHPSPPCHRHLSPRPAAQPRIWVLHVPTVPPAQPHQPRALSLLPLHPPRLPHPFYPQWPLRRWDWSQSWRACDRPWTVDWTPKSQRRGFCTRLSRWGWSRRRSWDRLCRPNAAFSR